MKIALCQMENKGSVQENLEGSFDQNIFIYTTLFSFPHHISYLNISPVPLSITVSYITTDTDFPPHQVPSAYASQIPYAHKIQPPAEHTP